MTMTSLFSCSQMSVLRFRLSPVIIVIITVLGYHPENGWTQPELKQVRTYNGLVVKNNCQYEIRLAISYLNHFSEEWRNDGWWIISPGEEMLLIHNTAQSVILRNSIIYIYAEVTEPGINYVWSGNHIERFEEFNKSLPLREIKLSRHSSGNFELVLQCHNASATKGGSGDSSWDKWGPSFVALYLAFLVGLAIYYFSPIGSYRTGFKDGSDGKPESFFYRHMVGEATKEAYRRGYHDGQMKRIGDK